MYTKTKQLSKEYGIQVAIELQRLSYLNLALGYCGPTKFASLPNLMKYSRIQQGERLYNHFAGATDLF